MRKTIKKLLLASTLTTSICTVGHSLDMELDYPLVFGDNTGTTNYDPGTNLLEIFTRPRTVETDGTFAMYVFPDVDTGDVGLWINVLVDPLTEEFEGVAGNDLELVGSIDFDGDFAPDVTGILLTGEIIEFSIDDNGPTDLYDLRFEITGGLIASWYGEDNAGVVNISENSSFNGDFTVPFSGEGKATLGRVEPLPPVDPPCTGPKEGFTPGYWKQEHHFDDWELAGIDTGASYSETFGIALVNDVSLSQALRARGGEANALLRHSTAALLNASHPFVNYEFTVSEIVQLVQYAFDNNEFEMIKDGFAEQNELGGDILTDNCASEEPEEEPNEEEEDPETKCRDRDRSDRHCGNWDRGWDCSDRDRGNRNCSDRDRTDRQGSGRDRDRTNGSGKNCYDRDRFNKGGWDCKDRGGSNRGGSDRNRSDRGSSGRNGSRGGGRC